MHCSMTNGLPSQVSPNVGMGRSDRKYSIEFVNTYQCVHANLIPVITLSHIPTAAGIILTHMPSAGWASLRRTKSISVSMVPSATYRPKHKSVGITFTNSHLPLPSPQGSS
jgi:hypothetical protein